MEYYSFLFNIFIQDINLKYHTGFRLLMEYYSFLFLLYYILLTILPILCFRLLMEYYSFLYGKMKLWLKSLERVSVSLWSIIHSYIQDKNEALKIARINEFPSPYGVLFILIYDITDHYWFSMTDSKFPSPYGVLFILIYRSSCFNATKDGE